jgi:DNA polymerase-3 subunit delta
VGKAKQIKWNQRAASSVILVSGPEDFLAARVVRAVREELRSHNPGLEVSTIDGADYESGQLIELTAPSLFDEPRLVIIEGVERCSDALIEDGLAYLSDLNSESTVIFRHSSGVRGKKLLDALRSSDEVTEVSCEKLAKEADRTAFAAEEFKALGKRISNGALRDLVAAFGDDNAGLAAACSQLAQDATESIDEKVVERYYGGRVEVDNFKVIDAATAGQTGELLVLLRHAFGSGQDPVAMVGAIAHKVRIMAKLLNNRSITAAQLGSSPWIVDKARRDLNGWTEAGMAAVVSEVARTDAATKGAERDPQFAVERLLLLISRKGQSLG